MQNMALSLACIRIQVLNKVHVNSSRLLVVETLAQTNKIANLREMDVIFNSSPSQRQNDHTGTKVPL